MTPMVFRMSHFIVVKKEEPNVNQCLLELLFIIISISISISIIITIIIIIIIIIVVVVVVQLRNIY